MQRALIRRRFGAAAQHGRQHGGVAGRAAARGLFQLAGVLTALAFLIVAYAFVMGLCTLLVYALVGLSVAILLALAPEWPFFTVLAVALVVAAVYRLFSSPASSFGDDLEAHTSTLHTREAAAHLQPWQPTSEPPPR